LRAGRFDVAPGKRQELGAIGVAATTNGDTASTNTTALIVGGRGDPAID
jgi:hypothetical protein